jgi:hypothetical protein
VTNTRLILYKRYKTRFRVSINDRIGPSDENNLAVDFSYYINTSEDFKLSFGLKASANLLNINFDKLNQYDPIIVLRTI